VKGEVCNQQSEKSPSLGRHGEGGGRGVDSATKMFCAPGTGNKGGWDGEKGDKFGRVSPPITGSHQLVRSERGRGRAQKRD